MRKTVVYETNQDIWRILYGSVKWATVLVGCFIFLVVYNWKLFATIKDKLKIRQEIKSISIINQPLSIIAPVRKTTKRKPNSCISMIRISIGQEKFTKALFALVFAFLICNICFLGEVILKTISSAAKLEEPFFNTFLIHLKCFEVQIIMSFRWRFVDKISDFHIYPPNKHIIHQISTFILQINTLSTKLAHLSTKYTHYPQNKHMYPPK